MHVTHRHIVCLAVIIQRILNVLRCMLVNSFIITRTENGRNTGAKPVEYDKSWSEAVLFDRLVYLPDDIRG